MDRDGWDRADNHAQPKVDSRLRGRREAECERAEGRRTGKGRVKPAAKACRKETERLKDETRRDATTTITQGDAYEREAVVSSRDGAKQQRGEADS